MNRLICLLITLLCVSAIYAQSTISGTVTESGSNYPLIGVQIIIEGTALGTLTDVDGKYVIDVKPEHQNLLFSYLGYDNVTVPLDGRSTINVVMGEKSSILDQVVISASKRKEKVLDAPASVSIISSEKLARQTALTPIDNMKKTPGVDIMTTGLVSANVNLRGFNGIFNGSMLTMVDNRIGRVPSLRVNAFQLIPGNNYDMEKIEIIRGPGSALYGPNAADGVMHIITKSPLSINGKSETTVSFTTGLRNVVLTENEILLSGSSVEADELKTVIKPEFRTVYKFNDNLGVKLSGRYMRGDDWEFYEPGVEPVIGQPVIFGSAANGEPWTVREEFEQEAFDRNFEIENYNVDLRLDYRIPNTDSEIVFAAGNSYSSNLELTGLGAARASGWNYSYGQVRYRNNNFYAQYFINASNAGDQTYLIPRGGDYIDTIPVELQLLVDKSKLHVVQLQNSNEIQKLKLIYGLDFLGTRPITEGTINGRNEDFDNFNQYGGYVQGEYKLNEQWKFVAASRLDYTDIIEEYQFSPRVAAVYKPHPKHTIRGTYNKAFSTPSNFAYSLDLANGRHPLWNGTNDVSLNNGNGLNPNEILMDVRGISNSTGYNYNTNDAGELLYHNFIDDGVYNMDRSDQNHVYFQAYIDVLTAEFTAAAPDDLKGAVPSLIGALFVDLAGENGAIQNLDLAGMDFVEFLSNGSAAQSLYNGDGDVKRLDNVERQTSETTETYELGYKGIFNNKFYLSTDFYYTQKKNIRSGLVTRSPYIIFDPSQYLDMFLDTPSSDNPQNTAFQQNLDVANNLVVLSSGGESTLADLIDGNPDFAVDIDPETPGIQTDGDPKDEMLQIMHDLNAQIALGLASPVNGDVDERGDLVEDDMIVTYVNQGNVDIFGMDLGFTYVFNKDIQLQGAASLVNETELEGEDDDGNPNGQIVYFNAPGKKFSLGLDHNFPRYGLGYGVNFRWSEGYYAESAPYFGTIDDISVLDVKVFYRPKTIEGLQLTLDVNNILGERYQNFPGTPFLGRMTFLNVAYTFGK